MLFFHLPSVIISFFSFTLSAGAGIVYLHTRSEQWDAVGASAVRLGFLFGALSLITGWGFTMVSWGTYWSWDPKVVSSLVMWFVYAGYLMLRRSVDADDRARLCAVYSILGYVSVPLAYLSSRLVYSLHPASISLTDDMRLAALVMLTGFFLLYACLMRFNMKLEDMQSRGCVAC